MWIVLDLSYSSHVGSTKNSGSSISNGQRFPSPVSLYWPLVRWTQKGTRCCRMGRSSLHPSFNLSICLSVCLSVCMSVCLSVCLYVCLSACLSVLKIVFLSITNLGPLKSWLFNCCTWVFLVFCNCFFAILNIGFSFRI